jgi:RNA polymerase sigma-70 factor (ECF subfamily)
MEDLRSPGAFDALVKRYIGPIYRYLLHLTRDASAAEDLTQDAFFKAWKNLWRFDQKRSVKAWLFAIARNTAFDYFKKKQPVVFSALANEETGEFADTIPDESPLPSQVFERQEEAADLDAALAQLPLKARSVVILHNTEDMTFQEIAESMDEPLNTVKSRYRRALALLRQAWEAIKK